MKQFQFFSLLAITNLLSASANGDQTLFFENFNNAQIAATRFTTSGGVQFTGQNMQLAPNSYALLNSGNAIPDGGNGPVRYSVIQSLSAGNINYPNGHESLFFVRSPNSATLEGYRIVTVLYSTGAYIGLNRVDSTGSNGLIGGSMFAPAPLYTLGPYEISVTLTDTADAVDIDVAINGVHSLSAHDTSPYRFTSEGFAGVGYFGTLGATYDNLQVTLVPEPSSSALLAISSFLCGLSHFKRGRN